MLIVFYAQGGQESRFFPPKLFFLRRNSWRDFFEATIFRAIFATKFLEQLFFFAPFCDEILGATFLKQLFFAPFSLLNSWSNYFSSRLFCDEILGATSFRAFFIVLIGSDFFVHR
jgi:hypothetical protein